MASNKTKHAISQLTDALKDGDAISLEILYGRCDGDLAAIAGALSSLIEKEEIQIGRNRRGTDWFIGNNNLTTSGPDIIWYNRKKQMRKVVPKLLKAMKKYLPEEPDPAQIAGEDENLAVVRNLLSDGRPRSKEEIIGITGLEDLEPMVWRTLPKLPDGRFTLPNSSGAWEYLLQYLSEKPRRLSKLVRLFRRHDRIIEALTAEKLQAPLLRLPNSLITTITSPAGQAELTRQEKLKRNIEKIEALPMPFFTLEDTGLTSKEFLSLADKYALMVNFEGHNYWCLRREFPGDILVEQLGEISGRYFAPPFADSASRFLRENSMSEKEAAAFLDIDEEILATIIKERLVGSFVLDGRIRLWKSDVQELKRDPGRLHGLITHHQKLSIPQAAAMLGISTGQLRQLINSGKLAAMPGKDNDKGSAAWLLQQDLENLRPNLSAYLSDMDNKKAKGITPVARTRKKTPRRVPLRPAAKELVLDAFQVEAAEALKEGLSVIVSAPTGNGKTLVAEMLARDVMAAGLGMIYTSPLKALSNQKFRDFKELFGEDQVGLVTGDVSINPGAPMLIMTTEIFRNWCLSEPAQLEKISYVVFDEIHYLDDMERGTTWEESILFAPPHIKILGLSATVPNADEMADWISSVRGGDVVVILDKKRRIPLSTQWILPNGKIAGKQEAQQEIDELIEYNKTLRYRKHWGGDYYLTELPEVSCSEIIDAIQDKLPALFFVFSRDRTELLAQELGQEWDFLNNQEKKEVLDLIKNAEAEQPGAFSGPSWRNLRRLLQQGIAYHHAGLLPPVKYLIEKLYANRMLWVVFCTETFAAGVNFPAASAVFDSTRKWDGHDFRILQNREFYQMAGRAGRRGYDRIGHAFIRVDSRFPEQTGFFDEEAVEPVSGRLVISPNTVLSLLRYKTDEEIHRFLNENFKMYQLKKKQKVLQEELTSLSKRLSDLAASMCSEYGKLTCPVERAKVRKKLKRKRWKNKYEKELLQKQLALHTPKKCLSYKKCISLSEESKKVYTQRQAVKQDYAATTQQIASLFDEYKEVRDLLERLGYIKGREFYPRGIFALELHVQEILVTELAFSGLLEDTEPAEAAAILAGVEFVPGRNTKVAMVDLPVLQQTHELRNQLLRLGVPEKFCIWSSLSCSLAYAWCNGASFHELLEMTSMQPGDIFSLFRREIDLLRQIERAAGENTALIERVRQIRGLLDRDEIALSF